MDHPGSSTSSLMDINGYVWTIRPLNFMDCSMEFSMDVDDSDRYFAGFWEILIDFNGLFNGFRWNLMDLTGFYATQMGNLRTDVI